MNALKKTAIDFHCHFTYDNHYDWINFLGTDGYIKQYNETIFIVTYNKKSLAFGNLKGAINYAFDLIIKHTKHNINLNDITDQELAHLLRTTLASVSNGAVNRAMKLINLK